MSGCRVTCVQSRAPDLSSVRPVWASPGFSKNSSAGVMRDARMIRYGLSSALPYTSEQAAAQAMEHMLGLLLKEFKGFVRNGPRDTEQHRAILESIPSIGNLLASLMADQTAPGWQRFLIFVRSLSDALARKSPDARIVFLIDPRHELCLDTPGDWIPLAEDLPHNVRLIVGQRPDDTLATHPDARRAFTSLLASPLGDLTEIDIEDWYESEFKAGHLPQLDGQARGQVRQAAYARYKGYPLAHRALITALMFDNVRPEMLADAIAEMPREVEGLLDLLYEKLCSLGNDHHIAALTLQLFNMPTPQDVWAKAAGLSAAALGNMLEDPKFAYLFQTVATQYGKSFGPFHSLFAERLEKALTKDDARRKELANMAWQAIEPALTEEALAERNAPFFELSAGVPVAVRCDDNLRILLTIDRLTPIKIRFGVLDEAAADMKFLAHAFGEFPAIRAAAYGNLGNIYQTRGDLDEAERLYRKSLEINEKLGRLEGMAIRYANLAIIAVQRGNISGARELWARSRDLFAKLGAKQKAEKVQSWIDSLPPNS